MTDFRIMSGTSNVVELHEGRQTYKENKLPLEPKSLW